MSNTDEIGRAVEVATCGRLGSRARRAVGRAVVEALSAEHRRLLPDPAPVSRALLRSPVAPVAPVRREGE